MIKRLKKILKSDKKKLEKSDINHIIYKKSDKTSVKLSNGLKQKSRIPNLVKWALHDTQAPPQTHTHYTHMMPLTPSLIVILPLL